MLLSTFPGLRASFSFALPASLRTKTIRAGEQFTEVGPHFINSYTCFNCSSDTGSASHPFWLRPLRNTRSKNFSSTIVCHLHEKKLYRAKARYLHAPRC